MKKIKEHSIKVVLISILFIIINIAALTAFDQEINPLSIGIILTIFIAADIVLILSAKRKK